MVTMRDRALIEARAKGLSDVDIANALRHPFRQLLKVDVVVSSFAISIFLLIYYTAVGFAVIYLTTVFGFSVKDANGLGNWNWGFNVVAVILIGIVSDLFRVRKPFMVIGGVAAAIMTVVFLLQFGHHPSYYTMAVILAVLSFCLGVAYVPWMASFTETVEARNPALIATGLAIWGWIIRIVVFVSYLIIPLVITSVTPLVNYGTTVADVRDHVQERDRLRHDPPGGRRRGPEDPPVGHRHRAEDPAVGLATATTDSTQLANAVKFAPELEVIKANPALFTKLAAYNNPATIPPALMAQAVKAAGGGAKGLASCPRSRPTAPAILGVIAAPRRWRPSPRTGRT